MEVQVKNVSRLVTKTPIEKLFEIFGKLEQFNFSLAEDGSILCSMVYANLSEAICATKISGSFIGDCAFTVELNLNEELYNK